MTAEFREPLNMDVLETAADWIDRLDALSPDEIAELQEWLAASEQNRRAFTRLEGLVLEPALREAVGLIRSELTAPPTSEPTLTPLPSRRPEPWRQPWRVALPMAAAVAGIAVLSFGVFSTRAPQPVLAKPDVYTTPIGVRADATLKDRSVVHLDADSVLSASFTGRRRAIQLERGEAMFEVSHDPARPFDVDAGGATVTAVGTVFDVDLVDGAVEVRVFQGVVRVKSAGGDVRLLKTGEQLILNGPHTATAARFSPDLLRTWRSDWLQAENMPLRQVVAKLNRYARTPIVLKSDGLSDVKLSGRFDLGSTDATVAMVSALLDLDVMRDARSINLVRRSAHAAK